jgi:hypothetical protein
VAKIQILPYQQYYALLILPLEFSTEANDLDCDSTEFKKDLSIMNQVKQKAAFLNYL